MTITKQQVIEALKTLRAGRSPSDGNKAIVRILMRHGNGARNITELDPKFYPAVMAAVGELPPMTTNQRFPVDYRRQADGGSASATPDHGIIATRASEIQVRNPGPPQRIRSPLTMSLESELAKARAKTKRSIPTGRVDIGNASQPGDTPDDSPFNPPAGEKMR